MRIHPRYRRAGIGAAAIAAVLAACQLLAVAGKAQETPKARQAKKDAVDQKTIRALIAQLGDNSFDQREKANKRLEAIGEPALELLQRAAKENADPEVRERVAMLISQITKGFFAQVRTYGGPVNKQIPWTTRVVVTPDGKRAVAVGYAALRSWDLAGGKEDVAFEWPKLTFSWALALSLDGKRVIVGSDDRTARVYDVKTGKIISKLVGHNEAIWGAALLADGKRAVTGAWDKSLRVWDVDSGKQLRAFDNVSENVRCLAVSPDGKLVAVGQYTGDEEPGVIGLWDLKSGKRIRALKGHAKAVSSVAFSPDGKSLVSAGFDSRIRVWDVMTGVQLKSLAGHVNRVESAVYTPNGKRIISVGGENDRMVGVWDPATSTRVYVSEPTGEGFLSIAALPDGLSCLTAGKDGAVRLWRWKR